MNPLHQRLTAEHQDIRKQVADLQQAVDRQSKDLAQRLETLSTKVQQHFHREEPYYRVVDGGKRLPNRELMHQMRNDHAAVIFSIESLAIRLRKGGVNPEWLKRFKALTDVLIPHLDNEENHLFGEAERLLSPDEFAAITSEVDKIG